MERTYVNIPEETKLYASEIATRRKDITGEHGLSGFIEGDIPEEGRVEVKIPLPCAEGADQEYESYFVDVNGLDIVEEDTEQVSPLTKEFEQSNLTEEEVETLHDNTVKRDKPVSGSHFDDEELSQDKIDEIENAYYESYSKAYHEDSEEDDYIGDGRNDSITTERTIRINKGVTYDYDGNRVGHLINDYALVSEEGSIVTLRNKPTSRTFRFLKTNVTFH